MSGETSRIFFSGSPYPMGHKIKKFVWSGRLDEAETLWFDFHLETDDYNAEDDSEDEEEPVTDWEAKIVWCNYHRCTISSTKWHPGGIKIGTSKELFDFDSLIELTADTLPLKDDAGVDNLAFHIYLLGHDSCANHKLKFTKDFSGNYTLEWNGKIALTYSGDDAFRYDFRAIVHNVQFDGFYLPKTVDIEKAKDIFARKLKDMEMFEFVDRNPKSNKREYKLIARR